MAHQTREAHEVTVRRVGYRNGTDAELTALHLIESEIEAERRLGGSQPLESYIASARNLPTQFADHAWLAQVSDGTPIGCSTCWSNSAGDPTVMECYVYVRPAWRRQGIGWQLIRPIIETAAAQGRSSLIGITFETVPAGEAFARRLGVQVGRVHRTSELRLSDVDWDLVRSWMSAGTAQTRGYRLERWDGPFPSELTDDAVAFHHIMQTVPRDDLQVADVILDAHHVIELDRALVEAGRHRWVIFVRDASGRCVGGTAMTFESWSPALARQEDTAIDPAHRGQGLAKWAKASMLDRIRRERPEVERVRTTNTFSNAPMLAINDKLGFTITQASIEWQGQTAGLRRALPSERWPG